jgi:RNA polymerase sigma-70 factor (ECF subfamily)
MLRWPRPKREPPPADPPAARRAEFERLAREHAARLFGAALRMSRHRQDAEDLAQETLVRAYAAWESFAPGSNAYAWLLRIMTNLYITQYRRRRRLSFVPLASLADEEDGEPELPDPGAEEPLAGMLARVLDADIEAALAGLSESLRLTVLLVDVEQASYEEAADALGIPVGTVRSRLNRGRAQLAARLAPLARARGWTALEPAPGRRPVAEDILASSGHRAPDARRPVP